jgi:hypothetical protein
MYEDRLEGRITPEIYDRKASDLRGQSITLSRRIDEISAAAPAAVGDAINLMDLTSRAADLFAVQPVHEKQGFLRLILKSATWREGELQTEFQQPFENLRRSNQLSNTKHKENGTLNTEIDIWLPTLDSNLEPGRRKTIPLRSVPSAQRLNINLPPLRDRREDIPDRRGRSAARAALHAEPEDQAAQYRCEEAQR